MSEKKTFTIVLAVDGSPHSEAAAQIVHGITWPAEISVQVLVVTPKRWSLSGLSAESEAILSKTLTSLQQTGLPQSNLVSRLSRRCARTI